MPTEHKNKVIGGGAIVGGAIAGIATGGIGPVLYGIFLGMSSGLFTADLKCYFAKKNGAELFNQGNYPAAMVEFEEAVLLGSAEAARHKGVLYELGHPLLPQDLVRARDLYRHALENGYVSAQADLDRLNGLNNLGVRLLGLNEFLGAKRAFEQAAILGEITAIKNQGVLYEIGHRDLPRNLARARILYQEAVDRGYPLALDDLTRLDNAARQLIVTGRQHEQGDGVPRNVIRARELYLEAEQQGYLPAREDLDQWNINSIDLMREGERYEHGRDGMPRNIVLARHHYVLASEYGLRAAQEKLNEFNMTGVHHINAASNCEGGLGVDKDTVAAIKKYSQAKEYGNETAQHHLDRLYQSKINDPKELYAIGMLYYHGDGINKDYAEALKWFTKANRHKSAEACKKIGYMYEHGEGVAADPIKAREKHEEAEQLEAANVKKTANNKKSNVQYLPKMTVTHIKNHSCNTFPANEVTFLIPCCIGYKEINKFEFLEACVHEAITKDFKINILLGSKDVDVLTKWRNDLQKWKDANHDCILNDKRFTESSLLERSDWRQFPEWVEAKKRFSELCNNNLLNELIQKNLHDDYEAYKDRASQRAIIEHYTQSELDAYEAQTKQFILEEVVDYFFLAQTSAESSKPDNKKLCVLLYEFPLYKTIAFALDSLELMKYDKRSILKCLVQMEKKESTSEVSPASSSASASSSTSALFSNSQRNVTLNNQSSLSSQKTRSARPG